MPFPEVNAVNFHQSKRGKVMDPVVVMTMVEGEILIMVIVLHQIITFTTSSVRRRMKNMKRCKRKIQTINVIDVEEKGIGQSLSYAKALG